MIHAVNKRPQLLLEILLWKPFPEKDEFIKSAAKKKKMPKIEKVANLGPVWENMIETTQVGPKSQGKFPNICNLK